MTSARQCQKFLMPTGVSAGVEHSTGGCADHGIVMCGGTTYLNTSQQQQQ